MDAALIWEWIIKSIILILVLLVGFAYTTYMERKFLARFQDRYGPNRAGPLGLLQPIADAFKLIFKEELMPSQVDKVIFNLAPILTAVPAWIILAVVPFGGTIHLFGRDISLSLASNLDTGILYISAIASISVYGIVLAGWSSNNKYAMMGGMRSSAQMISYELTLGLSWVGPILLASSMNIGKIVEAQAPMWFVVYQPLGFILFLIATLAEINRSPFDMPEAEQELTAGYHTEYSGMKFALFMLTEYTKMIVVSVIGAALFLGGYQGPFAAWIDWPIWMGPIFMFVKVFLLIFGIIWVRATLPRFRYDRLMAFGWKILLPLALANALLTAILIIVFPGLGK